MAASSSLFMDFRTGSELGPPSDDEEYMSTASTASVESEEQSRNKAKSAQGGTMDVSEDTPNELLRNLPLTDSPSDTPNNADIMASTITETASTSMEAPAESVKRPLHLLDLPMDMLQEIIKEVTHTNDLTSMALTCSALHALAIPQMYSRFDIVWPDTFSSSDHPAGVDALSYGLATLVMGEDVFQQLPPSQSTPAACASCGCSQSHAQNPPQPNAELIRKTRRGNYYAQYTRKFSVGNGPLVWVQEYSVTKETGKMLGTLVALAVARMVNLETFIWDMPTGVLRDVWIALASLAARPGHECRLERVWVRWHDNSDSNMRPLPTASSIALPQTQSAWTGGPPLLQRYGHVEYPSLSILPPLKSLSVLDIDEVSYLEETAVLIHRSREKLKELRIGMSLKVYQLDWLKPHGASVPAHNSGWPKAGGVLEALLYGSTGDATGLPLELDQSLGKGSSAQNSHTQDTNALPPQPHAAQVGPTATDTTPTGELSEFVDASEAENMQPSHAVGEQNTQSPGTKESQRHPSSSTKLNRCSMDKASKPSERNLLKLETLELERVALSIPVMIQTIDWSRLTTLSILRCDGHEKLWRTLRRQFAPTPSTRSSSRSKKEVNSQMGSCEYQLRIKHIHTDAVSPYLLLFIKDTLAPNSLETVFLHEAPMYDSIVHVDAIYRNIFRNHRASLKKILIDSTERSPNGIEISSSRWRKWMFTREMIAFITSGRMPQLREISMAIRSKDWHYFLQRLPYIPQLRALHISHIGDALHRDAKELAMQILDIVTIRPEIGLTYIGMQEKCYEILEGKRSEKDELDEVFVPMGEHWPPSDTNDDDTDDDEEDDGAAASVVDSHSELSSDDRGSFDGDDSDTESGRSRVSFRLREILFYDDKIAIFKARHGVL